jgi:hypothetical protein
MEAIYGAPTVPGKKRLSPPPGRTHLATAAIWSPGDEGRARHSVRAGDHTETT